MTIAGRKALRSVRPVVAQIVIGVLLAGMGSSCSDRKPLGPPRLHWYVFSESSGAFQEAAERCAKKAKGAYRVKLEPLPADADQQREQLVRRLAARDDAIDIVGMDVMWTAEFAAAKWILPWRGEKASEAMAGRIPATVESARYQGMLWAAPFTTNAQLLWYRTDRVAPPKTWDELIDTAVALGEQGRIQAQGERYEGLTVFFVSLLASAGGRILKEDGRSISLAFEPTRKALSVMQRFAASSAADPALSTAREDQVRLAFEAGDSAFMINYPFVWFSAQHNAPKVAAQMGWARWPRVYPDQPSRVTLGGLNLGVSAYSRHPDLALDAAACIAGAENQRMAAEKGGLPPTAESLYDEPGIRRRFPFADLLRETLRDAVQRPQTPLYNDLSLAISRTLHPLRAIDPDRDVERLRAALERALRSEGLL